MHHRIEKKIAMKFFLKTVMVNNSTYINKRITASPPQTNEHIQNRYGLGHAQKCGRI